MSNFEFFDFNDCKKKTKTKTTTTKENRCV